MITNRSEIVNANAETVTSYVDVDGLWLEQGSDKVLVLKEDLAAFMYDLNILVGA